MAFTFTLHSLVPMNAKVEVFGLQKVGISEFQVHPTDQRSFGARAILRNGSSAEDS